MSRTPFIAGNWKMNNGPEAAKTLAAEIAAANRPAGIEAGMCPPFVSLAAVADATAGTGITVGAQNAHWAESGAYTGEIAVPMLKGLVTYVIVGHSERRQYFGETDEHVNQKAQAVLANGLIPIICLGETLTQNEAGETATVVESQVRAAFNDISADDATNCVVAYEPVWAIGTGKTASSEYAQQVCKTHIRLVLAELYGSDVAEAIRILYGGSVKPNNAAEFAAAPDIDGALVGGASLKADSFVGIINNWAGA